MTTLNMESEVVIMKTDHIMDFKGLKLQLPVFLHTLENLSVGLQRDTAWSN